MGNNILPVDKNIHDNKKTSAADKITIGRVLHNLMTNCIFKICTW